MFIWKKRDIHAESKKYGEESQIIDFAWFLFIGMKIGFSDTEVGHMSYFKWKKLYEHYKSMYNFETKKLLFELEETETNEKKEEIISF
jgi:hypothetical protein